ncbi:uncharacterized protein LOC135284397 [Passer domesticus]|uniref:uncharacterized protein LOC135284397 n=2 Tax=Passer domesticus TaxID=48849 RepID=UPI0030FE5621
MVSTVHFRWSLGTVMSQPTLQLERPAPSKGHNTTLGRCVDTLCILLLPSPFTLLIPPIPRSFLTAPECQDFIIQPCRMLPFVLREAVPDREEEMEVDTKIDMEEEMEIDGEDPGEEEMDVDEDVEEEMDVDVTEDEEMDVDMEESIENMDID